MTLDLSTTLGWLRRLEHERQFLAAPERHDFPTALRIALEGLEAARSALHNLRHDGGDPYEAEQAIAKALEAL